MKVSIDWLKQLVDLKVPVEEIIRLLPLRTVGVKEVTNDFIELDMKGYNRADLLSLRGIAYEIAAITDSNINFSEPKENGYVWMGQDLPDTGIGKGIPSSSAPVYCIAEITGLKVEKSPKEWTKKLAASGIRSVNNLADITNLAMLEYGQPLHAFDALKSKGIRVDTAITGRKFITLDGKERLLEAGDILIRNQTEIIALGGVMGGKNSEVTEETTSIYLEAAIFDPVQIRKTAKRLGLQSEASKRFYHGLTKKRLLQALSEAIKMYEGLGGKLTAISLTGNLKDEAKIIKLTQEKINSLIGVEIPPEQVESSLQKLGFSLASQGQALRAWDVKIPYWRLDINIEEDLIEEVARMYGYEKIPPQELQGKLPEKIDQSLLEFIYNLKTNLAGLGLTEVQTYSFYSTQIIENLKLKIENLIHIANPISSETEYMRDNLWPNLLEVAAKNIRNGIQDVAIFEIGKVYSPVKGNLPKEVYHLSIALSNETLNPIQELYQIFRGVYLPHFQGVNHIHIQKAYIHPTRYTNGMAEIHPKIVNKFGIEQRVAVLEMEITAPQ